MSNEIPDINNCYTYIEGVSIDRIAAAFRSLGWSTTCSSWGEWKLFIEWSDLVLTEVAPQQVLLNGAVIFENHNIDKMEKAFKVIGGKYLCEFYDERKTLLLEIKNG